MALDTRQDRMSAIMLSLPFRGSLVDATEAGFTVGNRQAAAWFYSGISSGAAAAATGPNCLGIRVDAAPADTANYVRARITQPGS